jgi:hypothetical protein
MRKHAAGAVAQRGDLRFESGPQLQRSGTDKRLAWVLLLGKSVHHPSGQPVTTLN